MPANRKRNNRGNLADFSVAMALLFALVSSPVLNMLAIGFGYTDAYLLVRQCASIAADCSSIDSANNGIKAEVECSIGSRLAQLLKIKARHISTYVLRKNVMTGKVQYLSDRRLPAGAPLKPNVVPAAVMNASTGAIGSPSTPVTDASVYIYEYFIRIDFEQDPFVCFNGLAVVKSIPGIGRGWQYCVAELRVAEHADAFLIPSLDPDSELSLPEPVSSASWKDGWPPAAAN